MNGTQDLFLVLATKYPKLHSRFFEEQVLNLKNYLLDSQGHICMCEQISSSKKNEKE